MSVMAAGGLSRLVGPKYVQLAKAWFPTLATFGACGTALGLYFTDWKVVVQYIPYYGSKFSKPKE